MSLLLIAAPTDKARDALKQIGITNLELGTMMRDQGLVPALEYLQRRLNAFSSDSVRQSEIIVQAFGGGRSSSAIITLLRNLDELKRIHADIGKNAGQLREQYTAMLDTFKVKWGQFISKLQADMIRLGSAVIPVALIMMNVLGPAITQIVSALTALPAPVQALLVALAAIAVAAGPILIVVAAFSSLGGAAIKAYLFVRTLAVAFHAAAIAAQTLATGQAVAATTAGALSIAISTLFLRLLPLVAAFVVLDTVSRIFSGKSVMTFLSDAMAQSSEAAAGIATVSAEMEKFNDIISRGGASEAARASVLPDLGAKITEATRAWREATEAEREYFDFGNNAIEGMNLAFEELNNAIPGMSFFGKDGGGKAKELTKETRAAMLGVVDDLKKIGASSEELRNLRIGFPVFGQIPEFTDLIREVTANELALAEANRIVKLSTGEWTEEMIEAATGLQQLITSIDQLNAGIDAANKLQHQIDPMTAFIEAQISALEALKAAREADGDATEEYDDILAGLNARLKEQAAQISVNESLNKFFAATLKDFYLFGDIVDPTARSQRAAFGLDPATIEVINAKVLELSDAVTKLPLFEQIKISAILPFTELHRLLELIRGITEKKWSFEVAMAFAMRTPEQMEPTAADWERAERLPGRGGALLRERLVEQQGAADRQRLYDIWQENQNKFAAGAGARLNAGAADKLNKTEFGLLELAKAFEIFKKITNSESIPAFKSWLDAQKKLVEAQEAMAVRVEQARNPLLSMQMALLAIRTRILETNGTIATFLRNDVFAPALNAFKSALSDLFGEPSREVQELQLKKAQLELDRLYRKRGGASDKDLKALDKEIASIDEQIAIIEKRTEIYKRFAELQDQTIRTEQEILDQSRILGELINKSSAQVQILNSATWFAALTLINFANATNEVTAGIRAGAGSVSGAAVGGPVSGWSWVNEGASGTSELVKLPSGSYVFSAAQTRAMIGGGRGGDITINLTLQGQSRDQVKRDVMDALDKALVGASFGGGYIGSGSYVPSG